MIDIISIARVGVVINKEEGTAMPKVDGTAFNYGQYNEVLCALIKALPKALAGVDPIDLSRRLHNKGVLLEEALGEMLKHVGARGTTERRRIVKSHITPGSTMRVQVAVQEPQPFEGFEVEEDVPPPKAKIFKVGLACILDDTESECDGLQVIPRSEDFGPRLGEAVARVLFAECDNMPKNWDRYTLVFPGTTWLNQQKIPGFVILFKRQGEWKLSWRSMKRPFGRLDRIVHMVA